jgi:hypothetical protein
VAAGKKPSRVIGSVERWLLAQPKDTSRRTDVIHPSAMVKPDWCHRAEFFELQGHEPGPSKYKTSMKQILTFEEGHRIHARWQDWFGQMGNLYGKWECKTCGERDWLLSSELHEDTCGPYVYCEVPVHSDAHKIYGHADGWLKGFGTDLLLEVKSVGEGTFRWEEPGMLIEHGDFKTAWKNLKTPFNSHIAQAQVYMKLLEIMNPDNHPKEALFLYESKVDQEVKEFVVAKSDFGITELFDAAEMIVNSISSNVEVPCNINPQGKCQKCEVF